MVTAVLVLGVSIRTTPPGHMIRHVGQKIPRFRDGSGTPSTCRGTKTMDRGKPPTFRKPPFAKYPAGPGTGSTHLNVCGIRLRIKQAD